MAWRRSVVIPASTAARAISIELEIVGPVVDAGRMCAWMSTRPVIGVVLPRT